MRHAVHFRQWADKVGFEVCRGDEEGFGLFEYDPDGGMKAQHEALAKASALADQLDRAELRKTGQRRFDHFN